VAGTYVRIASYSGRMGLAPAQITLLGQLAADAGRPFAVAHFGSPYVGELAPKVPALLVAFDWGDAAEAAAARALLGEAPIGGTLPVNVPGLFPAGHGLGRAAVAPGAPVASGPRESSPPPPP
jgi:beta-N-acetylhexosaminidase